MAFKRLSQAKIKRLPYNKSSNVRNGSFIRADIAFFVKILLLLCLVFAILEHVLKLVKEKCDVSEKLIIGNESHSYEVARGWGKLPEGIAYGYTHGIVVDENDNVYVHNTSKD